MSAEPRDLRALLGGLDVDQAARIEAYIHRLRRENAEAREQLRRARHEIDQMKTVDAYLGASR